MCLGALVAIFQKMTSETASLNFMGFSGTIIVSDSEKLSMDTIIQSLGFTTGESLEKFIREKLDKFDKESNIIRANVTLFIGSDANPEKYYCEIRLEVPGNDHFGHQQLFIS